MDQPEKPNNRGLWLEVFFAVLVIGGGLAWLATTRTHENAGAAHAQGGKRGALNGPMPVATATAQKGNIDITVNALGTITPLATVTVRSQIAGQLVQLNFKEGQTVQAGDFLAQIDQRPYELALAQAQGQLQRDEALLAGAEKDLARFNKLVAQDSIARQQRDNQKTLVDQDSGIVETDKAQINTAKLNLAYCHIIAPLSGRIGLHLVDAGNYVSVNDTTGIAVITQTAPISALFSLPEDNLPAIMKRLNTGAVLPVTLYDRNQSTKLAVGQLATVDNVIDPATGTIKMRAVFDNADNTLFANQFVNVQLLVDTLRDAIVIPSSAVKTGAPGAYVYVVKPDSTVALMPVTLGPSEGENVSVVSGLNAGDIVVSAGADKLKDGAKVLLPEAAGADKGSDQGSSAAPDDTKGGEGADQSGSHHRRHKNSDEKDGNSSSGGK